MDWRELLKNVRFSRLNKALERYAQFRRDFPIASGAGSGKREQEVTEDSSSEDGIQDSHYQSPRKHPVDQIRNQPSIPSSENEIEEISDKDCPDDRSKDPSFKGRAGAVHPQKPLSNKRPGKPRVQNRKLIFRNKSSFKIKGRKKRSGKTKSVRFDLDS